MRRSPAEDVVECLSFSDTDSARVKQLQKVSPRKWERLFRWLDDAGLAFYLLRKLETTNADAVPHWVLSRLRQKFVANQHRVGYMLDRFAFLNQRFNEAGVRYAVLKGFSLVPEFCPDANLRHQSDFDYLVDDRSLLAAQRVLVEAGYRQKASRARHEAVFVMPGMGQASRSPEQSSAPAPHAVDLHLDVWESDLCTLPAMARRFSVGHTRMCRAGEFAFPSLSDEDAFLVQVLHACQHLFTYWIRMSTLWEIGYFLNQRKSDPSLWHRIEQQVGDNLVLRELVVVITELVAQLFQAPLPDLVRAWAPSIRRAPRVWIECYARPWAFCELPAYEFGLLPKAKLARFLHQQYRQGARKTPGPDGLLMSQLSRLAPAPKDRTWSVLDTKRWKRKFLIRRSLFHALAGLRYLCEIPRWRWRNRARLGLVSMEASFPQAGPLRKASRP